MTQDEIIRMAQQVQDEGFAPVGIWPEVRRLCELAFAAGAAHEREACANVCDGIGWGNNPYVNPKAGTTCAAAIRARGKNDCGGAHHHRYAGSFGD